MDARGGRDRARCAAHAAQRARCDRDVECRADGRAVLKVRVRAAPVEGEANDALRRLIAKALGIAPRQVELAVGAGARLKRLRIVGDPQMLDAMLERLVKGTG